MLDFAIQPPERPRGVAPHRGPINWAAIKLMCDRMDESPMKRARMHKRMVKCIKADGIESLIHRLRHNYCCARLELGDYSDYWGWEFRGFDDDAKGTGWAAELYWMETWLPKWGGGYVDRLLVLGEQGVGDSIFFASIIPEAMTRVKKVVYECDERLHRLLERSLPGLECDKERPFEERRPASAFIPAAELMRMFRRDVRHFPGKPYLRPDPERVREVMPFAGRTGIAWKARQGSIDPLKFGIDNPLSLQYQIRADGIEHPGIDLWNDIEGVVALCSVLERVVTVPTTVHHLAGAQGKIVDIVRPEIVGEDNPLKWDVPTGRLPWYANATVYDSIDHWKRACTPS